MSVRRLALLTLTLLLVSCATQNDKGTISQLKDVKLDLKDEKIEGGIEKAMEGYRKFLAETPESAMTPEAIRRLADLKIEKEYGALEGGSGSRPATPAATLAPPTAPLTPPLSAPKPGVVTAEKAPAEGAGKSAVVAAAGKSSAKEPPKESAKDFEKRATQNEAIPATAGADAAPVTADGVDLQNAGAEEAIELYKKLLEKYPLYERNDQVLYQMSRAYEELGKVEEAMGVMNRIVKEYPRSRYLDEIQFRRGEYFFVRKKFLDSEDAYKSIVEMGPSSSYFELALYKLGWSFYKQELYEDGLHRFVALLDHKLKSGFDMEQSNDEFEKKRVEDTYRVISLSFSYLGGAEALSEYFNKYGHRSYEVDIYQNLAEYYLDKRRYADAAATYKSFVKQNPFHKVSPHFDMRVIEIYKQGGFPRLVIEANKAFTVDYGLKSEYWHHFDVKAYPQVLGYLKATLKELANYYHALYQDKRFEKEREANFQEAEHWYREFLASFPKDVEAPAINYLLADLLLENKSFNEAAAEYERTAYDYPPHEKAAAAGYAAVYAHRENLAVTSQAQRLDVKRNVIRSSLRFADTFPQHEKAALVLGAALEDIFAMKDYELAVSAGRKLITNFPQAEQPLRRSAWLVVAHSSFELARYKDAEEGYMNVLQLTAADDASREGLVENLAASIYKQGEQANTVGDFKTAAMHFLRVGQLAPTSKIRPAADYDAATALIQLKEWDHAAEVLLAFRKSYPGHQLQPDVTKKIAYVYQQAGKLALAAAEYERIETETKDEDIRREALQTAAELYIQAKEQEKALVVYRRYVDYFPHPVEFALETRNKIASILKERNETARYLDELRAIVDGDLKAGAERTDRTRYLGATSALILTEPLFNEFAEIKLTQPFDKSLDKKKKSMKGANEAFGKLVKYEIGDVTAAATYYIAEIYYNFSDALKTSERPTDLNELEMEQYEEALDEQSYPFEEKAIQIHEKNLDFIPRGLYNSWIDKSLLRLATLKPGRYAKFEESSGFITAIDTNNYKSLTEPKPVAPPPAAAQPTGANGATSPTPQGEPANGTAPQGEPTTNGTAPQGEPVNGAAPAEGGNSPPPPVSPQSEPEIKSAPAAAKPNATGQAKPKSKKGG